MPNMGMKLDKSKHMQSLTMADALFSRTQQNVLGLLFGQPGQSFYTNEIIKKSGGGSGAVQRELSRLVRSGLVTVTRIGSQKLAFVFGSVAKGEDTASSDVDLMIVSESLTYADVFPGLEKASVGMGRAIQPSLYPREELCKRISTKNAFVTRVLAQPKIWIIGGESELPTR